MEQLTGLIGLTQDDLPLTPVWQETDYKQSSVGLYVYNLISPLLVAEQVDALAFQRINDAYGEALKLVPAELATFLGGRLRSRFQPSNIQIGEFDSTGIVMVTAPRAGFAILTKDMQGGAIVLSKIGVMLDAPVEGLLIAVEKDGELIRELDIDVTANDKTLYGINPLTLPLDGSTYTISYPLTGAYRPKNNQLNCGCGGKDRYINEVLAKDIRQINGNLAHGLILYGKTTCNFSAVAADLLINNQYNAAIAYLLYYRTGLNIVDRMLNGDLSPYAQLRGDDLVAKKTEWEAEAGKYLTWLTQHWKPDTVPVNRCYACGGGGMYLGGMRL